MKQITCPHCADTYPDFDVAHVCSKGPYAPKLKPKMNERIFELAEQAGVNLSSFQFSGTPTKYEVAEQELEKFAELIVRECVDICNDTNDASYLNGVIAGRKIKKHFGVEE